jgi:4-hydroxy-4-methyl-2-oxoglutarate aldolase
VRPFEGYLPAVPPRIGTPPERPEPGVLAPLDGVPASDVSDVVGRLYTMDPRIRPLYSPIRRVVGVALTVKAVPGDNLAIHGALGMVQPHDVLVVDWLGYAEGCGSGARALAAPRERGLEGVVVDGAWRDVDDLRQVGFPVFGRHEALFSPAKREPGEINVEVSCGGVVVSAGDVVVADATGVVVVPRRHFGDVLHALTGAAGQGRVEPDAASIGERHSEVFAARRGVRE